MFNDKLTRGERIRLESLSQAMHATQLVSCSRRWIEVEAEKTQQTVIIDSRGLARAAIEAMKEPTEEMIQALGGKVNVDVRVTYRNMIAAALA